MSQTPHQRAKALLTVCGLSFPGARDGPSPGMSRDKCTRPLAEGRPGLL